jgi:hypothetical protein
VSETSYTPGPWLGIVGANATVLLPPSAKERAGAVWALVDEGAGFDEVLDALVAVGLSNLPAFVLIAGSDDATRVVVRGTASATFQTASGEVTVSGAEAATWAERTLAGVTATSVSVGDEAGQPSYTIGGGLVRLSGLRTPPAAATTTAVPEPADEPYAPALSLVPPVPVEEPVDEPVDEPPVEEPAEPEPSFDDEPTDVDLPAAPAFPPPPAFAPPVISPEPPVPASPLAPPPAPPAWGEPSPPTPSGLALPVAHLELSSGQHVDVDQVVIIGRAPDPSRFSAEVPPLLISVPSPHQEISSTHLEVRPGTGAEHGHAVVTDLGSTNGTVLVPAGGSPEELRPGVPIAVLPGAVIDLGDGLTIKVTEP